MKKVAIFGECMVELSQKNGTMQQTFGGDTLNFAVYLKRSNPSLDAEYVTAVGGDFFSAQMLDFFKSHHIGHQFTDVLPQQTCGLYAISTDNGERSFTYWRGESAAKQLALCPSFERLTSQIADFNWLFFSGITLAILQADSRARFFDLLTTAKSKGVKIAFDPNYRPHLFADADEAGNLFGQALSLCDLYLPSFEDESNLYGFGSPSEVINQAIDAGVGEIIVKCGSNAVHYFHADKRGEAPSLAVEHVVDSTSAGDSFNGAYLAARLDGHDVRYAIKKAQILSAKVIMHQGAIIPNTDQTSRKETK